MFILLGMECTRGLVLFCCIIEEPFDIIGTIDVFLKLGDGIIISLIIYFLFLFLLLFLIIISISIGLLIIYFIMIMIVIV